MIADLPGALGAVHYPARRQRWQTAARRTLQIDVRARGQPPLCQKRAGGLQQAGGIGWIEEGDLERPRWGIEELQSPGGADERLVYTELPQGSGKMPSDHRIAIDEFDLGGTTRQRLDAQRAATG